MRKPCFVVSLEGYAARVLEMQEQPGMVVCARCGEPISRQTYVLLCTVDGRSPRCLACDEMANPEWVRPL